MHTLFDETSASNYEQVQVVFTVGTCSIRRFVRLAGFCTKLMDQYRGRRTTAGGMAYVLVADPVDGAKEATLSQSIAGFFNDIVSHLQLVGQLFFPDGGCDD